LEELGWSEIGQKCPNPDGLYEQERKEETREIGRHKIRWGDREITKYFKFQIADCQKIY
jgi:hypothetical protein